MSSVSLFPFLSVLACVMGTLTVLIAGLVVGQIDTSWIERSKEFVQLRNETSRQQGEQSELTRLLAEAAAIEQRISDARAENKRLADRLPRPLHDVRTGVELLEKCKSQRAEIQELEKLLQPLRAQLSDLANAVTGERDRPKDAILIAGSSGGVGTGLRPSFVECRSDRLVVHSPVSQRGDIRSIATELPNHVRCLQDRNRQTASSSTESQSGKRAGDALQDTQENRREAWSIVFLIRPDGVDTFQSALPHIIKRDVQDVQFGYLPLPGDGPVDFSLWEFEKR